MSCRVVWRSRDSDGKVLVVNINVVGGNEVQYILCPCFKISVLVARVCFDHYARLVFFLCHRHYETT
jgi:hypothetical protein